MRNLTGFHASFLATLLLGFLAPAAHAEPSAKIGTAALISPTAADSYYGSGTTSTNSLGSSGRPKEIVELARALSNDPDLIYEFVRNNIQIAWIYGLQKGALGTLIDRSGTAFDQAQLMIELLREAGLTASYKIGTIRLNGTEFAAWSGLTSASAACQLLSSGGIPAVINGTTTSNCGYGAATITTIDLSHAWVQVTIGGNSYQFDPSLKDYSFKTGVNLASVAGLTTGAPLTQAMTGASSGTTSGVNWVRSLNAGNLNSTLQTYGNALLSHIQTNFPAGEIEDLVGGAEIVRFVTPSGGLRQTTLPHALTVLRTWTGNVPDQYRTALRVQLDKRRADGSTTQIADKWLYADEIYGRKLVYSTSFSATQFSGALSVVDEVRLGTTVATYTNSENPKLSYGTLTLTVQHPYAAAADGSSSTSGDYMDATVSLSVDYATPMTIVHGWGDIGRGLVDKWGSRPDTNFPPLPEAAYGCETCASLYFSSKGDGRREQLAASWLAQSSLAARLHARIADSLYQHHHSIGAVSADVDIRTINFQPAGVPPDYRYVVTDSFDRVDIESAFSVTSRTANTADRRAAIQAIAATSAALEGSISGQIADLPDTSSTATRFEWGNAPPTAEDPSGGFGARRFYTFTSTNANQASSLIKIEGKTSTGDDGMHPDGEPEIGGTELNVRRTVLNDAITAYTTAGFEVVTSEEGFLGPGQRGGAYTRQAPGTYTHDLSKQRGGALIATRYASGEPVEIAHIVVSGRNYSKGGGGGAQTTHQAQYDPAQAADVLKARFVDRSSAVGVDLKSGAVTYQSPASLTVGNGDFPYSLTANLIWRGGQEETTLFGPVSHTQPQTPWTTNWNNALMLSSSGLEVMGEGDVRATAGTVAAFLAMQDMYRQTASTQRESAAALVAAWWLKQLSGNVVSANVGANTRQFVKLVDGNWIATGPGPHAELTVTGSRTPHTQSCENNPPYYVPSRGWNHTGMSFKVKNAGGDEQTFPYWETMFMETISNYCAFQHGFRLSTWTFPFGVTINLVYAAPGSYQLEELTEVNNSLGRKIKFIESGRGGFNNGLTGNDARSVSVATPPISTTGSATHTDPSGVATQFVASLGGVSGRRHLLEQVFTADHTTIPALEYTYDSLYQVKEAKDAVALRVGGRAPHQFLLADGLRGERIDPAGGRYAVYYDRHGRPFGHIDEIGRTIALEYDGRGRVTEYTYAEGDRELFTYDDHNNVTQLVREPKPGSSETALTVQAEWNQTWNKPAWVRDAKNNQTDFVYYSSGSGKSLLHTATRPPDDDSVRPVYNFTYNSRGQVLTATDPTGLEISSTYHATNGNLLTTVLDPTGINAVTTYTYDAQGDVLTVADPRANATSYTYDANRRQTMVRHHNGGSGAVLLAAEKTIYDVLGRPITEQAGTAFSGTTVTTWQTVKSRTYTPVGKVQTESNGVSNTTTSSYDAMDRLFQVEDPVGRKTRFTYDLAGQTLKEMRAYGTALQQDYATYTYSDNGQRLSVKDANGNQTDYQYDGHDRLRFTYFPHPSTGAHCTQPATAAGTPNCGSCQPYESCPTYERYDPDNNGNREGLRLRDGQVIAYSYDALNRQTLKNLPGGTASDVYSKYDLAGRPLWLRFESKNGDGIFYDYDSAKRLASEESFGRTVTFEYDAASNRTRVMFPDTQHIQYTYDALNRMDQVQENSATSGAGLLADYTYDALSRREALARGNGTAVSYVYDLASRLTSLTQDFASIGQDLSLTLVYTAASQLQSRSSVQALFDHAGPLVNRSYAANKLNQYSSVGGTTYTYDARGNLTSDGSRTFGYDVENHLTSVAGPVSLTLAYDPLGRLRQTTQGSMVTQFLYDGDRLIAEFNGSSTTPLRRYVYGPGVDEPITWYEGASLTADRKTLHADERGSIIATSNSDGVATAYTYDAYGVPNNWTGLRFRYTGQVALLDAHLYHYKARVYDPYLGRFLQTDPIAYEDDLNLYAYVRNDPLNNVDPNGTDVNVVTANGGMQRDFARSHFYLSKSPTYRSLYTALRRSSRTYTIVVDPQATEHRYSDSNSTIEFNPYLGLELANGDVQSAALGLAHEMAHAAKADADPAGYKAGNVDKTTYDFEDSPNGGTDVVIGTSNAEQNRAIAVETTIAKELGEPTRSSAGGVGVVTRSPTTRCEAATGTRICH